MPGLDGRLPIGFAHRGGASARVRQNTLAAFAAALAEGAPGLESDVLLNTAGEPVLGHPDVRSVLRLRRNRAALLDALPTLASLYAQCGGGFELALDMAVPSAAPRVVELARAHGAAERLWLTYWNLPRMREWRSEYPEARLVYPRLLLPGRSVTGTLDRLAEAGVDALNVYHRQCTRAFVEAAHARGLLVFAWGLRRRSDVSRPLQRGADGVFADDVPAMVAALRRV